MSYCWLKDKECPFSVLSVIDEDVSSDLLLASNVGMVTIDGIQRRINIVCVAGKMSPQEESCEIRDSLKGE